MKIAKTISIFVATAVATVMAAGACSPEVIDYATRYPDKTFVEVDGLSVNYVERGSGEDLVLLHGYASSLITWDRIIAPLSENYHVIAFDIKGFGFTEKPEDADYSPDALAEFARRTAEVLGVTRATWVGNSMGGAIALRLAKLHPEAVNRLVLIDAAAFYGHRRFIFSALEIPGASCCFGIISGESLIRSQLEDAYYNDTLVTPSWVEKYAAPFDLPNSEGAAVDVMRARYQEAETGKPENYSWVEVPTLIIWGENDSWIPLEQGLRLNSQIEQSKLVVIPDCGHLPQEEKPVVVTRAMLDWMSANQLSDEEQQQQSYPSRRQIGEFPAAVSESAQPAAPSNEPLGGQQ